MSTTSIRSTVVDNEVPDVALTVPAAPLFGTVALTATADDTDPNVGDESSGIANVPSTTAGPARDRAGRPCGMDTNARTPARSTPRP